MMLAGKPAVLAIFCYVAAVANVIIVFDTMRKLFTTAVPRTYSYLDHDYPLEIPVGPIPAVEMTFHEVSRFSLSDPEGAKNWETLLANQFGIGFQHLGPYRFRFISAAYHSLHCLYNMEVDFDKPNHMENPSRHFAHCLEYLRQLFLCNADLALEDGDFMKRNFTTDRLGQTRRCRDWSKVASWVEDHNREWLAYNGVSLD